MDQNMTLRAGLGTRYFPGHIPVVSMRAAFGVAVITLLYVQMESARGKVETESGNELGTQLVLYDPARVLPLYRPMVRYQICNRTIEIEQEWAELGLSAVVWDAAPFLSYFLEKTPSIIQKKRAIELGAGTGLVGMVANMLGANDVTITDMKTRSAEHNLYLNQHNLIRDRIRVSHLEWGTDVSGFNPPFDVILAADVIYKETFGPLLNTVELLSGADTTILLSCAHRYDWVEKFLAQVTNERKFRWTVLSSSGNLYIYQLFKL